MDKGTPTKLEKFNGFVTPIQKISIIENNLHCEDDEVEVVVSNLSQLLINTQFKHNVKCESCPVCLSPFKSDSDTKITKCNHTFHSCCLKEAKVRAANCPMCRTALTPNSDDYQSKLNRSHNFNSHSSNPIVNASMRARNAVRMAMLRREQQSTLTIL